MGTEQEYDDIIAPMLADVAAKCKELGMSLIARVEWEPDEGGITQIGISKDSGVSQRLAQIGVHARGNIDTVCIQALKNFDCSQSMFLNKFNTLGDSNGKF